MSHESRLREKLQNTRHTKINRYSEMHFDAPVRNARMRQWFNLAARYGMERFIEGLSKFGGDADEAT